MLVIAYEVNNMQLIDRNIGTDQGVVVTDKFQSVMAKKSAIK